LLIGGSLPGEEEMDEPLRKGGAEYLRKENEVLVGYIALGTALNRQRSLNKIAYSLSMGVLGIVSVSAWKSDDCISICFETEAGCAGGVEGRALAPTD
jgi:hypothetical protein